MSRLPSAAASRNMSACNAHAISQVGCRLMVASSANTSRPLAPAAWGDIACALATKAAISSEVEDLVSGSDRSAPCDDATSLRSDLVGSPGIGARLWPGRCALLRQLCRLHLIACRYIGSNRPRVHHLQRGGRNRRNFARLVDVG